AVAEVDVVQPHAGHALGLVVLRDRATGGDDALGVRVPLRGGQGTDHVHEDLVGRLESEGGRVADVELEDLVALCLHAGGLCGDRPADLVADVAQLGGLGEDHAGLLAFSGWASGYRRSPGDAESSRTAPPAGAAHPRRMPLPGPTGRSRPQSTSSTARHARPCRTGAVGDLSTDITFMVIVNPSRCRAAARRPSATAHRAADRRSSMSPQPAAPDRDVTVPRPGAAHRVHLAASGVSVLLDVTDGR